MIPAPSFGCHQDTWMDDIALQCHDREKPPRGFGMGGPRRKRPAVLVLTIAAATTWTLSYVYGLHTVTIEIIILTGKQLSTFPPTPRL